MLEYARTTKTESDASLHHIMLRKTVRQIILDQGEDYIKFIETLRNCKPLFIYKIYACCLMLNHIHI